MIKLYGVKQLEQTARLNNHMRAVQPNQSKAPVSHGSKHGTTLVSNELSSFLIKKNLAEFISD
jgi:hypothetical protein